MVEDKEIKALVSPFAVREGELKTFDGKDGYVSINQIIQKENLGHITDIHYKILELINEFEFATSRQLFQLLQIRNVEIKSQDKLNNKLEQMIKSKMLTRYYFSSEEGKGIYRIYALEKMGKYLLNSREIDTKWQPSDNTKPVEMIKKRLAGNQTIIAYMRKVKSFDGYTVKPAITAKMAGKVFKTSGCGVKLTQSGKSIELIYEAVRREENWETKFIDRMKLYVDFYTNFVQLDSGYQVPPQIILLCEDDKHMAEVFKEIVTNKIEIPKMKFYYTTDLKQNDENLSKSLYEFVTDEQTGKYKLKQVEIKLLG